MRSKPTAEQLKGLGLTELRRIWRETRGSRPPPQQKRLLLREMAWRIQAEDSCGLDAETQRLLRAAVRNARISSSISGPGAKQRSRPRRGVRLQAGAKLVRTWRGRKHEVTVLDGGKLFRYRGETYESLTKIAKKITSAHWSGPRFFGLDRVRRMS